MPVKILMELLRKFMRNAVLNRGWWLLQLSYTGHFPYFYLFKINNNFISTHTLLTLPYQFNTNQCLTRPRNEKLRKWVVFTTKALDFPRNHSSDTPPKACLSISQ